MERHRPLLPTRATDCAFRYTVRACYTSWVQTIPYRAAAVRPRQLPDGKSHHGHACSGVAGCGAQLRSTARLPSQFRQSLPAVRVVTHKTEASVRVSPQSVGMERGCLTISPQPAHEHPPSHPTVTYRFPSSGHTPHGSGWRDGCSKFGRSGPRYARALCSSQ